MKIDPRNIPPEGLLLRGETDPRPYELTSEEAMPDGPLAYELHAVKEEGVLRVAGLLRQPMRLRCVRCLEFFPFDSTVEDFAVDEENPTDASVDLTDSFREEILFGFPAYPQCDRDGGLDCPGWEKVLDTNEPRQAARPAASPAEDAWEALDGLANPTRQTDKE